MATVAPIIRGHGIPEAMEAVLRRQSRIPPRAAVAKPLASAIAIGTGGPFGAEGPIIVTGGAIGSLVGQVLRVTASERKILLASGAAAGMTATFGSPLAAILFAVELLLFELSMRTLIPLVVATSIAGGIHSAVFGTGPLFNVPPPRLCGFGRAPALCGPRPCQRAGRCRNSERPVRGRAELSVTSDSDLLASAHRGTRFRQHWSVHSAVTRCWLRT